MARDTYDNRDEIEVAARPDGLGSALIYVTTIVLIVAVILAQQAAKNQYNAGLFGEASATSTK